MIGIQIYVVGNLCSFLFGIEVMSSCFMEFSFAYYIPSMTYLVISLKVYYCY